MKREKVFGTPITNWSWDLTMDDDRALAEYIIEYLEKEGIEYIIEKYVLDEKWVKIRVNCDDRTMAILRQMVEDFEYDWTEETALA